MLALASVPRSTSTAANVLLMIVCALLLAPLVQAGILADPNPSPLPDCLQALSRRYFRFGARVVTNPALCTIGGLPYPPTTWAEPPGSGTFTIFNPTETASKSSKQFTPITAGPPTVVVSSSTGGSSMTTTPTPAPTTSSSAAATTTTAASITTNTNTGAGARRASAPRAPAGVKSIQRFSGLQISLTLFLGLAVLAGIVYVFDELLNALV